MKQRLSTDLGCAMFVSRAAQMAGCATQAPSQRRETTAATIRAAEEVGAAKIPAAALHLQLAEEQAEHASKLIERGGDVERADAELLLMRAEADADLALALAREDKDRVAAQQAVDSVRSFLTAHE